MATAAQARRTGILMIELRKNHQGHDILVTLTTGGTFGDPWPYRVTVERDGKRSDNHGYASREEALDAFGRAMGYACEHRARGVACRHFRNLDTGWSHRRP